MSHTSTDSDFVEGRKKRRVAETSFTPPKEKKFTDRRAGGRSAQGNKVAKVLPAIKTSFYFIFLK
jgi:hypothetical protein